MKTLIVAASLAVLMAASPSIAGAAEPGFKMTTAREQAIRECMAMQKRYPNEAWPGMLPHYRACMAARGQPE
jgi:hypothetical protein